MRADPRDTTNAGRSGPPSASALDSPRPAARSVPVAETPSEVPSTPTVTESISLLPEEAASQFRSLWDSGGFCR